MSLPTNTVTFLFTDIEGSTRLLQAVGKRYPDLLADHHRLLRTIFQAHRGVEVQDHGDGFYYTFYQAKAALEAVVTAQRAILAHEWPDGAQVRVRMGLHTGEPSEGQTGLVGIDIHRAARICSAAHGGQILLSQTTRDLVVGDLLEGMDLQDMGEHRLKDLGRPEHLFQVVAADLPFEFLPLWSLNTLPNNLPIQLTSFIGREDEKGQVRQLLSTTRLLTFTGTGGAGKTRLALQVAAEAMEAFGAGAWFVDLAPIADPALVPHTVASALGVPEQPRISMTESLVTYLGFKSLLLLLDNCEHLSLGCAELADALLRECPNLKILATSREALGIGGELAYPVPSLSLPKLEAITQLEKLSQYDAVRLFLERANFSKPGFVLTNSNAPAIVQVCNRLDGIPLAIELAAARVRVLSPEQIAARLGDLFRLLTGGSRVALPRQQTLRAAMDWSHDLLAVAEKALLRRLSGFAGGWTLEAAEAVCSGSGLEASDILDLLTQLVDKSLVVADTRGGEARYRLLETVRQYAWERLVESKEVAVVRRRHLTWCRKLAEQADSKLRGPEQKVWLERLDTEHDNLRTALEWSTREPDDSQTGLRLAGALSNFWFIRGHFREGRHWLERVLSISGDGSGPALAMALRGAGMLSRRQGDYGRARETLLRSSVLFRESGDKSSMALAIHHLAHVADEAETYEKAVVLFEESLVCFRELQDKWGVAASLNCLGEAMQRHGHHGEATPLLRESLTLCREVGDKWLSAYPVRALGILAAYETDYETATALLEESLAIGREMGDKWTIAYSQHALGNVALHQGKDDRAMTLFRESIALRRELGSKLGVAECLEGFGAGAGGQGQPKRAARLFGSAAALRESIGAPLSPVDLPDYDRNVATARAGVAEKAFVAAWAEGRAMTLEQAIEYALSDDDGA